MKVLLFQLPLGKNTLVGPLFPLGLLTIVYALKRNHHDVLFKDLNIVYDYEKEIYNLSLSYTPELIGLSLRNIDNLELYNFEYYYPQLKMIIFLIKKYYQNIKIVIGGSGFSLFPKEIMFQNKQLDFGVLNEGEETIINLINNFQNPFNVSNILIRNGDEIIETAITKNYININNSPALDFSFVNMEQYNHELSIGIQGSRGCPLKCSYCCYSKLNGDKLRCRSVEAIINEIKQIYKAGIKYFIFADSVFDINKDYIYAICNHIESLNYGIKWSAWFDVAQCCEKTIRLVNKAGCYRMAFSPDATTNKTLKALGKSCTEKDIKRLIALARKHSEIKFRFSIIASIPNDTWFDIFSRILFLFITHVTMKNTSCIVSWIRYLPKTPIYEMAIKEKLISSTVSLLPKDVKNPKYLFYFNPKTPGVNFIMLIAVKLTEFLRKQMKTFFWRKKT
jgi:radical SAM superfamily enzyme YgiQ (UPF0313 family)